MPHLSLDQPIDGIVSIKNLSPGHPVFLLVGDDGSHVVIKQEKTTDANNLRRNQLAMQMATPQARSVILATEEVATLRHFGEYRRLLARHGGEQACPVDQDTKTLMRYLNLGGTWFKMNEAQGLTHLGAVARHVLEGDKTGSRAFAKMLNASGGLEALGKVVAVDMFNANGDRFMPTTPGRTYVKYGTQDQEARFDCKVLVNVGNVMGALNRGQMKVIGLDSWDPEQTEMSNLDKSVSELSWPGSILAPLKRNDRKKFAQDIVDDLNLLLGPRNRRFAFLQQTRLGSDAAGRIVDGMESMTKKLIAKLESSSKRYNPVPAGFTQRLTILRGR